jgi:uncharacterized protein YcbK (DUF882 family)
VVAVTSFLRRQGVLVSCALAVFACSSAADDSKPPADDAPALPERAITLFNTHTNETVSVVFKRGDDFDSEALVKLNHVALDHRSGESHAMDARLFDQLFELAQACGVAPDFEIISGYRSPESNAKMAAREGSGVAKKSLHMQGRAIDVRLRKCPTARLRDLALEAKQGGVGYYQRSDFVHIDTGSFRTWTGK